MRGFPFIIIIYHTNSVPKVEFKNSKPHSHHVKGGGNDLSDKKKIGLYLVN